jgi:hypothetical protein
MHDGYDDGLGAAGDQRSVEQGPPDEHADRSPVGEP